MCIATVAIFLRLSVLGQLPMLLHQEQAAAPTTTVSAAVASSQPAAKVDITVKSEGPQGEIGARPVSMFESLMHSKVGEVFEGKRPLAWDDVKNPIFWFDIVKDLVTTILAFIPRLIGTLVFLFVFWLIYRGIRKIAIRSMKQGEVDNSIRDMLATLIKWCVMGFGLVIACNQLGIPIVAMLTGVSIIGLAIGFAAQETLANFIAGIVIFLDKPFKVGDWITIDDVFSHVKRVSFRSTRLLTENGETLVLPNTHMLANKLLNHSTHPINRINIPIGIAYSASIDEARAALLALTTHDARLANDPPPQVVVVQCADSSVNLLFRFWITDESLERKIFHEYLEKAKKALDKAGIEIPFPHMQVLLEKTEAIDTLAGETGKAA